MIVVLEGVDSTGKTTLANQLVERGFEYFHFGPPQKHALWEYTEAIEAYRPGNNWVFDRLHWGELVYGPAYRGKSELGIPGFIWLEALLESRGAVTVFTVGQPERMSERVTRDKDDYVKYDVDHLKSLQDEYFKLLVPSRTRVFVHNIDLGLTVSVDEIIRGGEHLEGRIRQLNERWPDYIGQPHNFSATLLVGDVTGPVRPNGPDIDLPFMPMPATSGRYLAETLSESRIRRWGLVNAHHKDGQPRLDLAELWRTIGQPKTVALGNAASTVLTALRIPHGVTTHPQYARRFHYGRREEYGNSIERARFGSDQRGWAKGEA